ncbi:hypothetical protein HPB47_006778 [Ixodes persulcatus]|uniref:Uncharacterized protein n=1 Tax=Ixodes persulcatus TaxID=34615 RepID=A0AC60P9C8_IXOPE|nr:hypothetical protein HPB47_006778 [Ixodes persulcatus]
MVTARNADELHVAEESCGAAIPGPLFLYKGDDSLRLNAYSPSTEGNMRGDPNDCSSRHQGICEQSLTNLDHHLLTLQYGAIHSL